MRRLFLVALAFASASLLAQDGADEIRRVSREAREARRSGDHAAFLAHSRRLMELAPRSTRARYDLARALALTGRAEEAVAELGRLADAAVVFGVEADADLAPLRTRADFGAVVARMRALEEPLGRAERAFVVPEAGLIPEGLAHDARTGAFFVSSVRHRKIVRVVPGSTVAAFTAHADDGWFAMTALAADPVRGRLWASSLAVPAMTGYRPELEGRSFVVELDLDSGRERRRLLPPADAPGGVVGDLAVGADGTLFVADPATGRLYVLCPEESALRVLVPGGSLGSPQGIAVAPEGMLFVADYLQGVVAVDPRSGAGRLLESPTVPTVNGIDGLVWANGALVGVQNGVWPHRVVRLDLDPSRARIAAVTVLARAHPDFDEPTLGVMVGPDFHFVANSQWEAVGEQGQVDEARLRPAVVLRVPVR